ncbi:tetratricopeptide repeat protein [Rhodopirellula sp. MGV]|uniref:tetratricopeptide repeat protein n=1 Tax=Rhodopirellula sp. MGV TaxID=2023130 RepID=UPI000B95EB45|nr:tetratricopeptide repeat protein [Rhodopirellula sp. MGV]OYP30351.1 hypothetical protein CGZ80_22990 [Rhodopirellula sp. MGV]PNY34707.1 tetratricopeptide repeat protein [Rhodopirellula baltica]
MIESKRIQTVASLCLSIGISCSMTGCSPSPVAKTEPIEASIEAPFDEHLFKVVGGHRIPRLDDPSIEASIQKQISDLELRFEQIAKSPDAIRHGKMVECYGEMGMISQCLESFDAAQFCYEQALQHQPDDYRWQFLIGHLHRLEGRPKEAKTAFANALENLQPIDAESLETQLAAMCWLGEIELSTGRTDEAETWFDKVLSIAPNHAFARYSLGRIAEQRDELQTAIEHLQAALKQDPHSGSIQHLLGTAYRRSGQLELAKEMLTSAASNRKPYGPYDPLLWAVESSLHSHRRYQFIADQNFKAQQYDRAIEFYVKALSLGASTEALAQTHCNLGSALIKTGQPAKALEHWKRAATLNPNHVETLLNLAALTTAMKQYDKSIELYRTVLASQPEHRKARLKLAQALQSTEVYAGAMTEYDTLLNIDPGNRQAWLGIVQIHIAEGRQEEARKLAEEHGLSELVPHLANRQEETSNQQR